MSTTERAQCGPDGQALKPERSPEDLLSLWDELLVCQVALTLPLELPHYYACREWLAAREVLDVGSGNGAYLTELARRFPDKRYRAVDSDPRWAGILAERCRAAGMAVESATGDIFHVREPAGAIVSRLVAQHLPSPEAFLAHVGGLLRPGGVFVSVEPHDGLRAFQPQMPATMELYRAFREDRARVGLDRDAALRMVEAAPGLGLSVKLHAEIAIPSTLPGHRHLFVRFQRLILDLFEAEYAIPLDRRRLESELDGWERRPNSYAQIGIHYVIFGRP